MYGTFSLIGMGKYLKVCQLCAVDFTLKHFLLPLIDGMEKEGWTVISVCSDGPYIGKLQKKDIFDYLYSAKL